MSLCLLSSHKKVGRGAGRSARSLRVWELCSHIGGCGGVAPQKAPGAHPPLGREKRKECRGGSTPSHFAPLQRPLLLLYHTPLPPAIPKKEK